MMDYMDANREAKGIRSDYQPTSWTKGRNDDEDAPRTRGASDRPSSTGSQRRDREKKMMDIMDANREAKGIRSDYHPISWTKGKDDDRVDEEAK